MPVRPRGGGRRALVVCPPRRRRPASPRRPAAANVRAAASPMPLAAPVTTATLPERSKAANGSNRVSSRRSIRTPFPQATLGSTRRPITRWRRSEGQAASMNDHVEIANLIYTYAERIDLGDFDGVGQLFENAEVTAESGDTVPNAGAAAVTEMFTTWTKRYPSAVNPSGYTLHTKHVTTNVQIYVDGPGETARTRSYFTVFMQTDTLGAAADHRRSLPRRVPQDRRCVVLHPAPHDHRSRRRSVRAPALVLGLTRSMRYVGTSVRRSEDPRLLTGRGRFVDDFRVPHMVHAAFLHSPHAHAHIRSIDVRAARKAPGVVAVLDRRRSGFAHASTRARARQRRARHPRTRRCVSTRSASWAISSRSSSPNHAGWPRMRSS